MGTNKAVFSDIVELRPYYDRPPATATTYSVAINGGTTYVDHLSRQKNH